MKAMMDLMKTMLLMPKPWQMWLAILIAANMLMPVLFIQTREAQVVLGSMMVGMTIMTIIFKAKGFVRLLGLGHLPWILMIPWLSTRIETPIDGAFEYWLIALITLNSITVIIDTVDVVRYVKGEREPSLTLNANGLPSSRLGQEMNEHDSTERREVG